MCLLLYLSGELVDEQGLLIGVQVFVIIKLETYSVDYERRVGVLNLYKNSLCLDCMISSLYLLLCFLLDYLFIS